MIDEDGKRAEHATFSNIKVEGATHRHIIRLYAIKRGEAEWKIGVDVHGYVRGENVNEQIQTEKLEIQQGLLVELYVNANMVMQHINKHYGKKDKRGRITNNDKSTGETAPKKSKNADDNCVDNDEVYQTIVQMASLIHEKIFHKSAEYCSGCQAIYSEATEHIRKLHSGDFIYKKLDVNQALRDDCFVGNNTRFILHHFPLIVADIACIHSFWKERPYITKEKE